MGTEHVPRLRLLDAKGVATVKTLRAEFVAVVDNWIQIDRALVRRSILADLAVALECHVQIRRVLIDSLTDDPPPPNPRFLKPATSHVRNADWFLWSLLAEAAVKGIRSGGRARKPTFDTHVKTVLTSPALALRMPLVEWREKGRERNKGAKRRRSKSNKKLRTRPPMAVKRSALREKQQKCKPKPRIKSARTNS